MMWEKKGVIGLIKHRTKRILLPMIIGTILVWPLITVIGIWGAKVKSNHPLQHSSGSEPDFILAIKNGRIDLISDFVGQGKDTNERDPMGVSALEWAALYNHPQIIEFLVKNGADIHSTNRDGSSALHHAAFLGRTESVEKLLELGADPNQANDRGDRPLDSAKVDMGIVQFIAGMLQLQFDPEKMEKDRIQTAEFLQSHTQSDEETMGVDGSNESKSRDVNWDALFQTLIYFPVFHHLWILYYLLWLITLYLMAVHLFRRVSWRLPEQMLNMPLCLAWLIPLTFIPQYYMTLTFGADTATGILPLPAKLAYYAVFFWYGALGFGNTGFEEKTGRHWIALFTAALPVLLLGLYFVDLVENQIQIRIFKTLCAVLYAWLMIFAMMGCFRRFFATENPKVRYLSDASYWLYLAHLPLVMVLQIGISQWNLPHFIKFILVCFFTIWVLMMMYEYLVRYSLIGTILNGKKVRPASKLHG